MKLISTRRTTSRLAWLLLLFWGLPCATAAFVATRCSATTAKHRTGTQRFLSDIPEEQPRDDPNKDPIHKQEEKHKKKNEQQQRLWSSFGPAGWKKKRPLFQLPPAPQDWLVLGGDLFGLTIYGITDHLICSDLAQLSLRQLDTPAKLEQAAGAAYTGTPVWLAATAADAANAGAAVVGDAAAATTTADTTAAILQVTLHDKLVTTYSPIWHETGAAVVILSAAWLLSGWVCQSFGYHHTLQCRTDTALLKTLQTWMTMMILLTAVLWISHAVHVQVLQLQLQEQLQLAAVDDAAATATATAAANVLASSTAPWITKGDMDYMVGSLTVLAFWRFLISSMLGTGQDSDSDDD